MWPSCVVACHCQPGLANDTSDHGDDDDQYTLLKLSNDDDRV